MVHRLVLEKVSKSDDGSYCCRASNDLNIVFSNWVEVSVQQPVQGESSLPPSPSLSLSLTQLPLCRPPKGWGCRYARNPDPATTRSESSTRTGGSAGCGGTWTGSTHLPVVLRCHSLAVRNISRAGPASGHFRSGWHVHL